MADKHEFVISARQEGFAQTAQEVLSGTQRISRALSDLEAIKNGSVSIGASAFDGVEAFDANVRAVDKYKRALADLDRAQRSQRRMENTITERSNLPRDDKKYLDPGGDLVKEMRLGAASRVDRAAEGVANALRTQTKEIDRATAEMRRRQTAAILGPGYTPQGSTRPFGPIANAQGQLLQAAEEGRRRADIEARRAAQEDIARGAESGKQFTIARKRSQQEDLDRAEAAGKQYTIQLKRTMEEDLAARKETGKIYTIQQRRMMQEDLANAAAAGKQFTIQQKRVQDEDIARARELGKQYTIQAKRTQEEDLARRDEAGKIFTIQQKRVEEADLAARKEAGKRFVITQKRREQADLAAYEQRAKDAEGLRQAARYAGFQTTYSNPATSTALGRAQGSVNTAERRLFDITEARTALLARGNYTAREINRADGALASATSALARARAQVAIQQQRLGQGSTFGSQFATGFRGASDRPYAEQLGQAFKFSVFYGTAYKLLFAFTTTLQATLQEGIAFQSAMTELKIASGQSADAASEIAASLGETATAAGQAPSLGVQLGARSLGLFGATSSSGATAAEQERIAEISARVVSRMALGTKTDPMELQTQIAAVANAFGGGAQGQIVAADLDAYLGRKFGIVPGETIQAVAESGTVGQAAGFNQEEVFAIAAALQSRTGQTSSAVAGWMAQIFSRGGEGSLTALTGKYGIDQTADLATQIQELSKVYQGASNQQRAEIAAGFGRGKVQNAAVVLLDELPTILREAGGARTGSVGESDRIFETRMNNIGGQIQQTIAVFKAFASELGRSGILDVLGLGIVAFRELVRAATEILQIWNQIPGVIKTALASIALLGVASRTAALSTGGGALLSRAGLITPSLAASTGVRAPVGGIVAGAGARGFAAAGAAALASVAPFAAAVGGLLAIAAIKSSVERMKDATDAASQALQNSGLTPDSTSSDYVASASELDNLALQNREATGKFLNILSFGQADNGNIATAEELEREANRRRAVADRIDARQSAISVDAPAISSFDADGIAQSLDLITASGGTADDRLRALTQALQGTGDAAIEAASAIDPLEFSGRLATLIKDGVDGLGKNLPKDFLGGALGDNAKVQRSYQVPVEYDAAGNPIMDSRNIGDLFNASASQIQSRLKDSLKQRGVTSLSQLDKGTARDIAESVVEDGDFDARLDDDQLADARKAIIRMITTRLRREAIQWRSMLKKNTNLTKQQVKDISDSIVSEGEAKLEELPETDLGGRVGVQRGILRNLLTTQRQGDDTPDLIRKIATAKSNVARAEIARLEQVRRAQQQNARSAAGIRRAGNRALRGELQAAIRGGNVDDLAEVLSRAGAGSIKIARDMIARVQEIAQTAIRVAAAQAAVSAAAGNIFAGLGAVAASVPDISNLLNADEQAAALANMTTGDGLTFSQGSDVEGTDKYFPDPETKSPEDKKAEREQARQEMLDLKNNLYLLSIDLSDPLAMAVAAVKDARRRLQSDRASGQSKGTIAADRVALRQAEIEKEATAFQQRLEAVQTAEELGRISHRKYISYLENERRRLASIKDRTYQQQQQLDEIDRLMKDAAEAMQGQWNFGDIKLPTPYQVRRQVEQMRVDRATQLDATSRQAMSNSTIYIDGADTGKVRQIIEQTLGKANATVTNRPRRR